MGSPGGGRGGSLKRRISPITKRELDKRGEEIRDLSNEHLSVYDRNGREILSLEGDSNSIMITASQLRAMRDADVTHNHPGEGGTFSWDDLNTLVIGKLNSLSAVDAVRTYTLERDLGIFTNRSEFVDRYRSFSNKVDAEVGKRINDIQVKAIANGWSDARISDEFDSVNEWSNGQVRRWLTKHSKKYGYTYSERED